MAPNRTRDKSQPKPLKNGERREGDYVIAVGARHGVVFYQGHWVKFECSICLRERGLLVRRLGTNDSVWARRLLYAHKPWDVECSARPKHR